MLVAITKQVDSNGIVGNERLEIHNPPHNIQLLVLDLEESMLGIADKSLHSRIYNVYSEMESTIRNMRWLDWAVAGVVTELSTGNNLELTYETLRLALTSPTISLDYILIPGELISDSDLSKVSGDIALDLINNIWIITMGKEG